MFGIGAFHVSTLAIWHALLRGYLKYNTLLLPDPRSRKIFSYSSATPPPPPPRLILSTPNPFRSGPANVFHPKRTHHATHFLPFVYSYPVNNTAIAIQLRFAGVPARFVAGCAILLVPVTCRGQAASEAGRAPPVEPGYLSDHWVSS